MFRFNAISENLSNSSDNLIFSMSKVAAILRTAAILIYNEGYSP